MLGFRLVARATQLAVVCGLFATAAMAEERFSFSADGQEVTDNTTHLTWSRCAEGMKWDGKLCQGKAATFDFAGAKKAAAAVATASGKAWRVPTKDELTGIVVKNKKKPMIDQAAFPATPNNQFWATRPGFDDNLNAWLVNFSNGKVYGNAGERKFNLRLVRAS